MRMPLFRKAVAEDAPLLKALSKSVIRHNYTPFLGAEAVDAFIDSGSADAEIDDGLARCTVMIDGSSIIGFSITDRDLLHLIMIAVEYQRKGYGAKLLAHVEAQMFNRFEKIRLQTFYGNAAAIRFYQKYGWVLANSSPQSDAPIEMVRMEKACAIK